MHNYITQTEKIRTNREVFIVMPTFLQWLIKCIPRMWQDQVLWHLVLNPLHCHFRWDQTYTRKNTVLKTVVYELNHRIWSYTYHNKSMSTIDPASIVIGLSSFSICSTVFIDLPMPPCMQIIFFSISAASGRQLNIWLKRVQAQIPSLSPYVHINHIINQPPKVNTGNIFACSCIPFSQCTQCESQKVH